MTVPVLPVTGHFNHTAEVGHFRVSEIQTSDKPAGFHRIEITVPESMPEDERKEFKRLKSDLITMGLRLNQDKTRNGISLTDGFRGVVFDTGSEEVFTLIYKRYFDPKRQNIFQPAPALTE